MKYSFLLLLFISYNCFAQKVEILLIGVSHNYGNYPNQDFSDVYSKIRNFKPDAFFGEFVSKEEERNLMDYWCKSDNIKRLEILKKNRNLEDKQLPYTIDSLRKLTLSNPLSYKLKVDLAHAYYLDQDVSNAHYQYWQVFDHLLKQPNTELQKYVDEILSPNLDVSGRSMKRLKTSEYAFIAFPMMRELKIRELIPMDCQDYDLNWSASALAFHNKFEPFKKDTAATYSEQLRKILDKRNKGFEKYSNMEKTSIKMTEWLNTDEASSILASGDFYFSDLYELKGFPKEEMISQIHWWLMRNKLMSENVVNRARALKHKKVVVIVGANHRKYMQDIFAEMPNVMIKNINEINRP